MTVAYRKLPGQRRGFIRKSSVWAGPDHLLLVRGSHFRDEYKRFYYRDVQAIAVARAPRFHLSTRFAAIGAGLWFVFLMFQFQARTFSYPAFDSVRDSVQGSVALFTLILLLVWVYVSAAKSCRCRIYTAVSGDELPSVYRIWTARKFLAEVQPLIAGAQGALEGEWAAAAEERTVGPSPPAHALAETTRMVEPGQAAPRRALVTDLFLATLFADAVVRVAPLPPALNSWLPFIMPLITLAAAIAVMLRHRLGRLRTGMNRVAVASLIAFGVLYYVHTMTAGIAAGVAAAKTGKQTTAVPFTRSKVAQQAGAGFDAILIIVGLIVSLRQNGDVRRSITG